MKGTEFKTTTIVVFSVYSLSNYGLNYNIFMRASYTLSVFVNFECICDPYLPSPPQPAALLPLP